MFLLYSHDDYVRDVEKATNEISQKKSITTERKGMSGFRDKFTFYKVAIFFAYGYISLIQTMIIFLGITPQAIININGFLAGIGVGYQFPVDIASFVSIMIIFFLFVFGIFAMKYFGLFKRESEIGAMQSPGNYLIAKQNDEIIQLLKKINGDKK